MKYEYEDVHMLFKKMAIDTKELWNTMSKVDELLHDPEFEETLKTFSWDELETLDRFFRIHHKYALELTQAKNDVDDFIKYLKNVDII